MSIYSCQKQKGSFFPILCSSPHNLHVKSLKVLVLVLATCIVPAAFGQALTWGTPQFSYGASTPGGVAGRPSVGGYYLGGFVYGAISQGSTTQYLLTVKNGGGANPIFSNLSNVYYGGFIVASNTTPAMTVMNGRLYMAYTIPNGTNYIISSLDGINWTGPAVDTANGLPAGTQYNPSLTSDPSTNTIYAAYANGTTHTPIVCKWVVGTNPTCNQYYSLRTENFNPGIAFWQGLVYLGYADRGDNHCLYFYKYTPSTAAMTNWMPIGCSEQTSAGPSLAVRNNWLYVGFRSNDSSAKFTVRVSTDGVGLAYRQQPGFSMDGYPQLVTVGTTMLNVFARSGYISTSVGQ